VPALGLTDGERIVIGVDIGGERSDSAVVWVNEHLNVGVEVLSGDRAVLEIADVVRELAERFTIVECAFDPWRAGQIGQELEQRGIRVSAFPQHDSRMIPASQRLHDAITEGRLVHGDDPRLNAHVATAVAHHGRRGWRIDKANWADKIDAVIALAMALDRLENRRGRQLAKLRARVFAVYGRRCRDCGRSDVALKSTTSTATRWTTGSRTRSRCAAIATTRRRSPASEGIRRNIAYSDSPAASRASSRVKYSRPAAILPSRIERTVA
jgi:hypothetical protein